MLAATVRLHIVWLLAHGERDDTGAGTAAVRAVAGPCRDGAVAGAAGAGLVTARPGRGRGAAAAGHPRGERAAGRAAARVPRAGAGRPVRGGTAAGGRGV